MGSLGNVFGLQIGEWLFSKGIPLVKGRHAGIGQGWSFSACQSQNWGMLAASAGDQLDLAVLVSCVFCDLAGVALEFLMSHTVVQLLDGIKGEVLP